MKEGKSKCIKCEFWQENTYTPNGQSAPVTNYAFNIEFEDGVKGLYNAKDKNNPKFKIGEEAEYTAEEKQGAKGVWYVIRAKQKEFVKGGGVWKPKDPRVFALELARKMYNSSQQTEAKWDVNNMIATAEWIVKQIESGVSRDALESASIVECSNAMDGVSLNSKVMADNTKLFSEWLLKK